MANSDTPTGYTIRNFENWSLGNGILWCLILTKLTKTLANVIACDLGIDFLANLTAPKQIHRQPPAMLRETGFRCFIVEQAENTYQGIFKRLV